MRRIIATVMIGLETEAGAALEDIRDTVEVELAHTPMYVGSMPDRVTVTRVHVQKITEQEEAPS